MAWAFKWNTDIIGCGIYDVTYYWCSPSLLIVWNFDQPTYHWHVCNYVNSTYNGFKNPPQHVQNIYDCDSHIYSEIYLPITNT